MKLSLFWLLRLTAAVILAQTLYFKFMASEESVYIFQLRTLWEDWYWNCRVNCGNFDLIPRTTLFAIMGCGILVGDFCSSVCAGIEVKNDGGTLLF
jgi:hypothetical protein